MKQWNWVRIDTALCGLPMLAFLRGCSCCYNFFPMTNYVCTPILGCLLGVPLPKHLMLVICPLLSLSVLRKVPTCVLLVTYVSMIIYWIKLLIFDVPYFPNFSLLNTFLKKNRVFINLCFLII